MLPLILVLSALGRSPATATHLTQPKWTDGDPHQQARLTSPDAMRGAQFGVSVAISDDTAIVASPYGPQGGAAYVFVRSEGRWSLEATLVASGEGANGTFGSSVAISRGTAVVGAPDDNAGAAYAFVRSGSAWDQQAKLTPHDPDEGFGTSVAISGDTLVVGAPGSGVDTGIGAAYVFGRTNGAWHQDARLEDPDAEPLDQFGQAVSLSGLTAVVGAPGKESGRGAAFVFGRIKGGWSAEAKLAAPGAASGDRLGSAVAISGSTIMAGAPQKAAGSVLVFFLHHAHWGLQVELTAPDGAPGDAFGAAIALLGPTAVVGADHRGNDATGAGYVFRQRPADWVADGQLRGSDSVAGDRFGAAVAISAYTALVGAPYRRHSKGAAYAFLLPEG